MQDVSFQGDALLLRLAPAHCQQCGGGAPGQLHLPQLGRYRQGRRVRRGVRPEGAPGGQVLRPHLPPHGPHLRRRGGAILQSFLGELCS